MQEDAHNTHLLHQLDMLHICLDMVYLIVVSIARFILLL